MKYHSGDIVRIKPLKEIERLIATSGKGPGRNPKMDCMCGQTYEIRDVVAGRYVIDKRYFVEERFDDGPILFI